jgi:hypothetical protein
VQGGYDGNANIDADPQLVDPGCGTPCAVDMGACEYQGQACAVTWCDIDGDGVVGVVDFLYILADWGGCEESCCLSDLDLDGDVGVTDFLLVFANWTA